jgi:hypothetical protein
MVVLDLNMLQMSGWVCLDRRESRGSCPETFRGLLDEVHSCGSIIGGTCCIDTREDRRLWSCCVCRPRGLRRAFGVQMAM